MDIQEENKMSYFAVLTADILCSKDLNNTEKVILAIISSLQNKNGYCFAGNNYIANILNTTPESTSNIISQLVRKKWLFREVIRNEKNEIIKRILWVKINRLPTHKKMDTYP